KERRFAIAHDRLPLARRPLRIPNRRSRLWNGIRCVGRQSPDEPRLGNTECEPAVARGRLETHRCAWPDRKSIEALRVLNTGMPKRAGMCANNLSSWLVFRNHLAAPGVTGT